MLYFSKYKIAFIILVCLLALFFSAPNFVPDSKINSFPFSLLPEEKVSLGLDLRGGSHLLLQIDFDFYLKEQLNNLKDELKKQFLEQKIRSLPILKENKIAFTLNDSQMISQAKKIIIKIGNNISFSEKDGKFEIFFTDLQIVKMRRNLMSQSIEIVRRRIDETGTKEPIIQAQGNDRILLQVPGVSDPAEIKRLLGKTAKMTFHFVTERIGDDNLISDNGALDLDTQKMYDSQGRAYLIKKQVILSGDLLVDANPTYYEGQPAVSFRFNNLGAQKFAKITRENVGRIFAIVLDGQVVTAPRINTVIDQGSGVISGNFTTQQAHETALLLRAGALPAPLVIIEERTVGPSLGLDSIKAGSIASVAGLVLVAIFMMIFYRLFGLIANLALVINIALILTALSLLGATLTLPGIAGIVLTMGMAVDANVLIFERIKEEDRNNKSLIPAIDLGFSGAFRTIIDSNITTLAVACLLYIFGNGPVRGFAVTLSIGILASMFSAIMLTRMMIVLWIKYKKPQTLPL